MRLSSGRASPIAVAIRRTRRPTALETDGRQPDNATSLLLKTLPPHNAQPFDQTNSLSSATRNFFHSLVATGVNRTRNDCPVLQKIVIFGQIVRLFLLAWRIAKIP